MFTENQKDLLYIESNKQYIKRTNSVVCIASAGIFPDCIIDFIATPSVALFE